MYIKCIYSVVSTNSISIMEALTFKVPLKKVRKGAR